MTDVDPRGDGRPHRSATEELADALSRHRLLAFGAPVLTVVAAVLFVLAVTPVYESLVSIRIDEQGSGVAVLEMLQQLSRGGEVPTEMAVMRSRSLAEDVVDSLDLQLSVAAPASSRRSELLAHVQAERSAPEATYTLTRSGDGAFRVTGTFPEPRDPDRPFSLRESTTRELGSARPGEPLELEGVRLTLSPEAAAEEEIVLEVQGFQDAVEDFQSDVSVSRPDREADVVVIRYRGGDPQVVAAATNALARRFIERRQDVQTAEARSTVRFLEEQIDTLEGQLRAAEVEVRDFREANQVLDVEAEASTQLERLAELQARRDMIETEREALSELLREIEAAPEPGPGGESPYRRLIAFPSLLQNPAASELLRMLGELENQRSELRARRREEFRDVEVLNQRIEALEEQLRGIAETYLTGLTNQHRSFERTLATFQDELSEIPEKEMTYLRLRRQAEILSELYSLLRTRQKEAEIAAAVEDVSVRVVDPALVPLEPVRPKPFLTLAFAVLLGGVVGVGGAVAREHGDTSVRRREHLQAVTGVGVLGLIPEMDGEGGLLRRLPWVDVPRPRRPSPTRTRFGGARAGEEGPCLVAGLGAGDPATEAYRSLRTNLTFARPEAPPRVIVFTSPMPGDGKSTTAANLALTLAQRGGRVLLVDADMRRGTLHDAFGEPREPGLSNLLLERAERAETVREVVVEEGVAFDLLPAGTTAPNPAELLGSERMDRLLDELIEAYDAVLLDAPPLNLVTDAAILGTHADGVILVARAGVTEEEPLNYAVDQLEKVRAPLLGTVLNGVVEREQDYYGSGSGRAHRYYDSTG